MNTLLSPVTMGDLVLPNRLVMSPLTRSRAGAQRIPNQPMAQYYSDRASAGLIISEATSICPMGVGYADTPGIWNRAQIDGWREVVDAVHAKNGRIMLQLWHVGRISHPMFLPDNALPIAPSAIKPAGHVSLVRPKTAFVTPRALRTEEIADLVQTYRQSAIYAKEAGFDGVEIHAANGYLIDQFLQDSTNQRTDQYGGSIENRARFLLDIVDAVVDVWGAGRVGVHLAPRCDSHDMGDSDPLALFTFVAKALGERQIAFIFARESQGAGYIGDQLKQAFGGPYIVNEGLTQSSAADLIKQDKASAAAFGKLFIANPDLPKRFELGGPLNTPDPSTFYTSGDEGYNDYPFYQDRPSVKKSFVFHE